MWHQTVILRSYEITFCAQKKKKTNNSYSPIWRVSAGHKQRVLLCVSCVKPDMFPTLLWFDLNKNNLSAWRSWHRRAHAVYVQRILSKLALWLRGGDELLKFFFFLFSFVHKKLSHSFVKLQLNPWCHMDYFTDLLATSIKNILICVLKMNEGFTGLKLFLGELTL